MTVADKIAWNEAGLVPVIAQSAIDGGVAMVAWMNREALALTLSTKVVHFWSRSRSALWKKGETSGNTLALTGLRLDCDGDVLLATVIPAGPSCHTGATSCFFQEVDLETGELRTDDGPSAPAAMTSPRLDAVIAARKLATSEKSYTRSLFDGGWPKMLGKIAEEHGELAAELPGGTDHDVVHETADLLFHVMVALAARDLSMDQVWSELARRFGVSGHEEKASR